MRIVWIRGGVEPFFPEVWKNRYTIRESRADAEGQVRLHQNLQQNDVYFFLVGGRGLVSSAQIKLQDSYAKLCCKLGIELTMGSGSHVLLNFRGRRNEMVED